MKKFRIGKAFLMLSLALMVALGSVSASGMTAEAAAKGPTSITLSSKSKKLYVKEKATIKIKKVSPAKASKSVKYTSSNTKVATVDKKGRVTAKAPGKATITVTSKVKNSKKKFATAKYKVTVLQQVKGIQTASSLTMAKGKSVTLKTTVTPANANNKGLTFKSSNTKVATVNKKGKITAKKPGKATITVTSKDKKKSVKVKVTVKKSIKKVTSVAVTNAPQTMEIGSTYALKTKVEPKKATAKKVYWTSSNVKVATVDKNGKVKAVGIGTAKITASSTDSSGKYKTVTIKVIKSPAGVALNQKNITLKTGTKATLKATITPTDVTEKSLKWSSSNANVAAVDANGVVTAKNTGKAVVTVATANGKTATCTVNVVPATISVSSIEINSSATECIASETITVSAKVMPANATNKKVTWTSGNALVSVTPATGETAVVSLDLSKINVTTPTVSSEIKATADGKSASVKVTFVLKKDAKSETDRDYIVTLDKRAASIESMVDGRDEVFSVLPKDIEKDLVRIASKNYGSIEAITNRLDKMDKKEAVSIINSAAVFSGYANRIDEESAKVTVDTIAPTEGYVQARKISVEETEKTSAQTIVVEHTAIKNNTIDVRIKIEGRKNAILVKNIAVAQKEGTVTASADVSYGDKNTKISAVATFENGTVKAAKISREGTVASFVNNESNYVFALDKNFVKDVKDTIGTDHDISEVTITNIY